MKAIKISYTDAETNVSYTDSHHLITKIDINDDLQHAKIHIAIYNNITDYNNDCEPVKLDSFMLADSDYSSSDFATSAAQGTIAPDVLLFGTAQDYLMTLTTPYDYLNDGTAL